MNRGIGFKHFISSLFAIGMFVLIVVGVVYMFSDIIKDRTPVTMKLSSLDLYLKRGVPTKIEYTLNDDELSVVAWNIDNNGIAKVTTDGFITGYNNGYTKLRAVLSNDKEFEFGIRVNITTAEYIKLKEHNIVVSVHKSRKIGINYYLPDNKVKWTSSNPDVVKVDDFGYIYGVSKGKATITVSSTDKKFTDKCKVEVT